MPGSTMICDFAIPALRATATDLRSPCITSFITSRANPLSCIVRGSPRMCIRISGTRWRAATSAIRGSLLSPDTSLTSSANARIASSATLALRVSTEMGIFRRPRSASRTGKMRSNSSEADVSTDPGRVDSPPMSSRSAPARSIAKACSIALSGCRNLPPSEKLSGVTFNTPITSVRSPRTSVRELSLRRKSLRNGLTSRGVLGLLHCFFKLLRQDVFLVRLLEEGIGKLVFALPRLLLKDT